MARIRSLKPEFWLSEEIGLLSRDARLLYLATWNVADDEGLLRWNAAVLKGAAFVYDDDVTLANVERLMAELVDLGLVIPYRGGRTQQRLGWIPSFRRHQKPNRPQPSKLPPPSWQNPAHRAAVAERDGWICGLCGESIAQPTETQGNIFDDRDKRPVSESLEVDHVVPRAKGGSEYPSNVQATHKACNRRKGTTPPVVVTEPGSESDTEGSSEPNTAVGESRGGEGVQGDAAPSAPPTRRGSRIPQPFKVSAEQQEWAESLGVDWRRETEKFVDHFKAAPGQRGVKLDWTATWRNWMRRAAEGAR